MNFEYDAEQAGAIAEFRAFCEEQIKPVDASLEEKDAAEAARAVRENLRLIAGAGGLGWHFPKDDGGRGLSMAETVAYVEAVGAASAATLVSMDGSISLCAAAIRRYGTPEQKEKYLAGLLNGTLVGAFAVTEWEAGSDLGGIKTGATRIGDGWEVYGRKAMITNASVADVVLLLARTDAEAKGSGGLSLFLVDGDAEGLSASEPAATMGLAGSAVGEIAFEGVRLGKDALLGKENDGRRAFFELVSSAKITFAAGCVGVAWRIMDLALVYANTRQTGGKPIYKHQEVSFKIADMRIMVDGSRLLVQYAAWMADQGSREVPSLAACAKLFSSESVTWIANQGLQIHGGLGYLKKCAMERRYRDARFFEIGLGTSEIQRGLIADLELAKHK